MNLVPETDSDNVIHLLTNVRLLQGFSPEELLQISQLGHEESFLTRQIIFSEGDIGEKFYLILDGAVRVSRIMAGMGEETLSILHPGSHFGEMSLIDGLPRSAQAIVHQSCRLFAIHKSALEQLLISTPALGQKILWGLLKTVSSRLRKTNDKMIFLTVSSKF